MARRWRTWGPILLIMTALWADSRLAAAADEAGELKERVGSLIGQLDANERAMRVRAERELLELGPRILPHLPASELLPSAASREAVRRIRIHLERRQALESVQSSTVTMRGEFPVSTILDRFAAQTGNTLSVDDEHEAAGDQILNVEFEQTPFWQALDAVAQQAKLKYRFGTAADVLVLAPTTDNEQATELAVGYSGPFRIAITSASTRPIVGNEREKLLRIGVRFAAEPRLRPLFLHYKASDLTLRTLDGKALEPLSPKAAYERPLGDGGQQVDVVLDYRLPEGTELPAVSLGGKLGVQLAAGAEEIVFRNPERMVGAARRRGGVTLTLRRAEFKRQDDGSESRIGVAVSYEAGGPAFESHRTWIFHNKVFLEDTSGERIEPERFRTSLQTDGAVAIEYQFADLPLDAGEYRFVYVAPTLITTATVDVEFAKIPVGGTAGTETRDAVQHDHLESGSQP